MSANDYKGLVAVVTGAASGMGEALSEHLASKGFKVVGTDVNAKGAEVFAGIAKKTGAQMEFLTGDVTDWLSNQKVFKLAVEKFGTVDVAFANAGVSACPFPLPVDRDPSQGPRMVDIHVNQIGAINTIQAALDVMRAKPDPSSDDNAWRKQWRGKIIVTSSNSALYPLPFSPIYCGSKAGIMHTVQALAPIVSSEKILVNVVLPGLVETPMSVAHIPDQVRQATKEGLTTPMQTMLEAFEYTLPADYKEFGVALEAVPNKVVPRKGYDYYDDNMHMMWERLFVPEHAHTFRK